MVQQKSRSILRPLHPANWSREQIVNFFKRTVERLQDAVEFDSHLQGQSPAGAVIGSYWRPTRIEEIVRMVLRFEHVDDVGPKGLSRFHD